MAFNLQTFFGNNPPAQVPASTDTTPSNMAQAASKEPTKGLNSPSNPVTGTQIPDTLQTQQKPDISPLDRFNDLLYNSKDSTDEQTPNTTDLVLPADELAKLASGINFTDAISATDLEGINNGDSKSLINAMQAVSSQSYQTALQHFTALHNQNMATREATAEQKVSSQVSSALTSQAINSTMDNNHPIIVREAERIASLLRIKNPGASPQDIAEASKAYMTELAQSLTGTTAATPATQAATPTDGSAWDDYFKP